MEREINITIEQAVQVGHELRRLIKTTAFETALAAMREDYKARFFNSRHEEKEKREQAYLEAKALDDLLIAFNTFINIAESEEMLSDIAQTE